MTGRTALFGVGSAIFLALAAVALHIGERAHDEGMTALAGVVSGILAAVPVCVGLLFALTRERIYTDPQPRGVSVTKQAQNARGGNQ